MQIGQWKWSGLAGLAPMAGVTDRPFRQLCNTLGAAYTVSEMVTSNPELRHTKKSRWRSDHRGESEPIAVQIVGTDPEVMADAARYNRDIGAQIVDINMGCPAKKVCKKMAGSALLADPKLVERILTAVVNAVEIPVTLKIRTGLSATHNNAVEIATIAEHCGIQALAIHGRSRAQKYKGYAEYNSIRQVKKAVNIPILANGDINTPEKAKMVLKETGADGLLIGRAAHGNPWVFQQIHHYLATGKHLPPPDSETFSRVMLGHIQALHEFYGPDNGVRIARKHINWYLHGYAGVKNPLSVEILAANMRKLLTIEDASLQLNELQQCLRKIA
ncbi:MAG: tRNA dihydrouridine synthase DusB [Xanthomonadales bacterium]|nr:tRNA dihydrouridine synthase DusB [Xanthomonadales bacterium]